jgi:predicted molibdopterin-dependent oxidoreductase YjgC
VDADKFPGGIEITPESAAKLAELWKHPVSSKRGLRASHLLDRAERHGIDFLYTLGGNYLDTLPDPEASARALGRIRLRVHQDILINASVLVEPEAEDGTILVLPAQTRYEQRGGGTSTTTERRIRFSPEISGRRIGETKPEWEIPVLIGRAAFPDRPDLFDFDESGDVRREMGRVMPLYRGIENLEKEGQWVQWGGERLGTGGRFPNLPGERARFSAVPIPAAAIPKGYFFLTSRRGKQFNSIIYGTKDGMTGVDSRRAIFFSPQDAERLRLKRGDPVVLRSELGTMEGVCEVGPCRTGHLQAFWPECNVLVGRTYDPASGEPDYNALVQVEGGVRALG